jgi:hypothetical protein
MYTGGNNRTISAEETLTVYELNATRQLLYDGITQQMFEQLIYAKEIPD